jgi:uncharacterized protein
MATAEVRITTKGTAPERRGDPRTGPVAPDPRPLTAPASFHVLTKPSGPICNLDCTYCFFLSKEALYPGDRFRMGDDVLGAYIRQVLESQVGPEVTIAWQGGEPTLMGVDFFRRALELVAEHRRPGQQIEHTIQTNATLLTDEWCELLAEHRFLVGVSIDGPRELHDRYRVDKRGEPTFDKVMRGVELLRRHQVAFNVLHGQLNQDHPSTCTGSSATTRGAAIQLIPIVERTTTGFQEGDQVTDCSVDPDAWGRFLIGLRSGCATTWHGVRVDVRRRVGLVGRRPGFDVHLGETCGDAVTPIQRRPVLVRPLLSSPTTSSATSSTRTSSTWWPRRSSWRSGRPSGTRCRATAGSARCGSRARGSAPATAST